MISIVLFDSCRTKTETVEQNATFFLSKLIEINVFSHSNDRVANKGKNPSRRNHCHLIKTGHKRFISALEWLNLKFFFLLITTFKDHLSIIKIVDFGICLRKHNIQWNIKWFYSTSFDMIDGLMLFKKINDFFIQICLFFLLSLHLFYQQIHWLLINEGNHLKQ